MSAHKYLIPAAASFAGGILGDASQEDINNQILLNARQDRQQQRSFAKHGIRWRVEDAKDAGIHPLYAMGASVPGFTPSPISLGSRRGTGRGLASAGQDIGRAISATATAPERALSIERARLENRYLEAQIMEITRRSQTGPPLPSAISPGFIPGQQHPAINVQPLQVNPSAPGQGYRETGAVTDSGFVHTATGLAIVPSEDVKDRIEDMIIPEMLWAKRNVLDPFLNPNSMQPPNPEQFPLPPGYRWRFNRWAMEWQPKKFKRYPRQHQRPRRHVRPNQFDKPSVWGDTYLGG